MTSETQVVQPLSGLEALVMTQVWHAEPTTVRAVMDALNGSAERQRAYTTCLTIMVQLYRKGLLDRRRDGKTDIYSSRISRDEYREARVRSEVTALVRRYGDVALVQFARHLASARRSGARSTARLTSSYRQPRRPGSGAPGRV